MQPEQFINQSVDVSILALSTSCQADCEDIQPAKSQAERSLVSDEAGYFRRPYVGCVPEVPPEPIVKAPSQRGKERQNRLAVTASAASIIDYAQESEERLLAAARASDERAFLELSSRSSHSLRHMVLRIVRNREDTEDVMQEALLKAYTHLSDFRGTCSFSTWLTGSPSIRRSRCSGGKNRVPKFPMINRESNNGNGRYGSFPIHLPTRNRPTASTSYLNYFRVPSGAFHPRSAACLSFAMVTKTHSKSVLMWLASPSPPPRLVSSERDSAFVPSLKRDAFTRQMCAVEC